MLNEEIENAINKMRKADSEKLFSLIDETIPEFKMDTELTQADIDKICPRQAD